MVITAQGTYLVAEDETSAEAWVDAVLLLAHTARTRSEHALASIVELATNTTTR